MNGNRPDIKIIALVALALVGVAWCFPEVRLIAVSACLIWVLAFAIAAPVATAKAELKQSLARAILDPREKWKPAGFWRFAPQDTYFGYFSERPVIVCFELPKNRIEPCGYFRCFFPFPCSVSLLGIKSSARDVSELLLPRMKSEEEAALGGGIALFSSRPGLARETLPTFQEPLREIVVNPSLRRLELRDRDRRTFFRTAEMYNFGTGLYLQFDFNPFDPLAIKTLLTVAVSLTEVLRAHPS